MTWKKHRSKRKLKTRAIITTSNIDLRRINQFINTRLAGESVSYSSADKLDLDKNGENGSQHLVELTNTLTSRSALLGHNTTLTIALPVIIIRNIDLFRDHVIKARDTVSTMLTGLLMLR